MPNNSEEKTANDLVQTPDRVLRFWIALCGSCVVFGGFTARLMFNDWQLQESHSNLQQEVRQLTSMASQMAVAQSANTSQRLTYQEGSIREIAVIRNEITEMRQLMTRLLREL